MTTTPPDEPQAPGTVPTDPPPGEPYPAATPPPVEPYPAPSAPPPVGGYAAAPPPGGYNAPPPGGYNAPPLGGYNAPPPGYGAPGYGATNAGPPLSDSEQRQWAMLAHLGGILFAFIAPLVVWAIYKERGAFVEDQAKEALNFQILLAIGYVVGLVLSVVGIGLLILLAVWIATIVFSIMGGMAANRGELYRYPINWRVVK